MQPINNYKTRVFFPNCEKLAPQEPCNVCIQYTLVITQSFFIRNLASFQLPHGRHCNALSAIDIRR